MASGLIGSGESGESGDGPAAGETMRVSVRTSVASTITREINASARTEPDRAIELKAETEGMVVAIVWPVRTTAPRWTCEIASPG